LIAIPNVCPDLKNLSKSDRLGFVALAKAQTSQSYLADVMQTAVSLITALWWDLGAGDTPSSLAEQHEPRICTGTSHD